MRPLLLAVFTSTCLTSLMAQTKAVNHPATCMLEPGSIIGQSATGVPQASNFAGIQIQCSVQARLFPSKPGDFRNGLVAKAIAYDMETSVSKEAIEAETKVSGGGSDDGREWVLFFVLIPLKSDELEAEARRAVTKFLEKAQPLPLPPELSTAEAHERMMKRFRATIYQNRTGHFLVECRVMDGNEAIGTGTVDVEVLFKGRFSDYGLPGAPPA